MMEKLTLNKHKTFETLVSIFLASEEELNLESLPETQMNAFLICGPNYAT